MGFEIRFQPSGRHVYSCFVCENGPTHLNDWLMNNSMHRLSNDTAWTLSAFVTAAAVAFAIRARDL